MFKIISILTGSIFLTTTFFVNCGGPAPKNLDEMSSKQSFSEDNNNESGNSMNPIGSNTSGDNNNIGTGGNGQNSGISNQKIQIAVQTNQQAQTDCSSAGAQMSGEIINASVDVRACAEFILDLPVGSKRHGEYYYCDSPAKFDNMLNKSDWTYESAEKKWTIKNGGVLTRNSYFVPGIYRMIVLDKDNNKSESAWITVGRKGYEDCSTTSQSVGSAPQKRYFWIAIVAGPVQAPTSPTCGAGNVGAKTFQSGYEWTCVYQ